MQKEYILCAAIKYYNQIVTGFRHSDCRKTVKQLVHSSILNEEYLLNCECGFITNINRFVTRKEAYKIAFEAGQIIGPNKGYPDNEIGLTSEDLY